MSVASRSGAKSVCTGEVTGAAVEEVGGVALAEDGLALGTGGALAFLKNEGNVIREFEIMFG